MQNYISEIEDIWNNTQIYKDDEVLMIKAQELLLGVADLLNSGKERSCYKDDAGWHVNLWIKKAILLMFKLFSSQEFQIGDLSAYDKILPKFSSATENDFNGIRVVPNAYVRNGVFLGQGVVLMPSFVNVGAYIDSGTMVDSMATIGSCAQIGKNCHIASAVTIAGVLEPMSDMPVIIEDNCFIGAGSQISEGVLIEEGSVVGSGVVLSGSTRIYDRNTKEFHYGRIPPYSVVVPGTMPIEDNTKANLICGIIVKTVDENTRKKTSINDILRI